jgi:hypothetical protein
MSEDYHQKERIEKELLDYIRILNKSKEEQTKELTKEPKIPAKPISLSNLPSPISNRSKELSNNDNIQNLLEKCSTCLIEYGRKVLP